MEDKENDDPSKKYKPTAVRHFSFLMASLNEKIACTRKNHHGSFGKFAPLPFLEEFSISSHLESDGLGSHWKQFYWETLGGFECHKLTSAARRSVGNCWLESWFGMNSEFRADFVNNVEFNAGPGVVRLTMTIVITSCGWTELSSTQTGTGLHFN